MRAVAIDVMTDAGKVPGQWQFDRLILWLSDPEPADLPLPARQNEAAAMNRAKLRLVDPGR